MTVLNTWQKREGESRGRYVFLQCSGCFPPRLAYGTEPTLARFGWGFDDIDEGPHRCPSCPRQGARKAPPSMRQADPALPNLLVIGAPKCGTTSLHHYLSAHPEIQMPAAKELRFFQDPRCLERLDDYAGFFDAGAPVRGEATPAYSCYPLLPGVPDRIREAIPGTKLIYLVREPVERAIAAYAEARANDKEVRSADAALREPDDPYNAYVAQSRYAMQISQYIPALPREQLLILDQRELLVRRSETLRRTFRFLGVDENFTSARFEDLTNTREAKRRRNRLGRTLRRSPLAPAVRRIPPGARASLLRPLRSLTSRRIEVTVDPQVRRRLETSLHGELERLTGVTGAVPG